VSRWQGAALIALAVLSTGRGLFVVSELLRELLGPAM